MQQPQNQHSSGYMTVGALPLTGFGIIVCVRQWSAHLLQPTHFSTSIITVWHGAIGFGTR